MGNEKEKKSTTRRREETITSPMGDGRSLE